MTGLTGAAVGGRGESVGRRLAIGSSLRNQLKSLPSRGRRCKPKRKRPHAAFGPSATSAHLSGVRRPDTPTPSPPLSQKTKTPSLSAPYTATQHWHAGCSAADRKPNRSLMKITQLKRLDAGIASPATPVRGTARPGHPRHRRHGQSASGGVDGTHRHKQPVGSRRARLADTRLVQLQPHRRSRPPPHRQRSSKATSYATSPRRAPWSPP